MKSNSSRGRPIANDTSVQTLFMNVMAMHSKLVKYIQEQEDTRVHYEGLQIGSCTASWSSTSRSRRTPGFTTRDYRYRIMLRDPFTRRGLTSLFESKKSFFRRKGCEKRNS